MKKIRLTQGKYALVDDEDFERLNTYKWHLTSHSYAETQKDKQKIYMHRLVNNTPKDCLTDHINRNTLDNRKSNLRIADKRINSINRAKQSNNTSGYKGVSWDVKSHKWAAYIWRNGKKLHLGHFDTLLEAARSRNHAETLYHVL